MKVTVIDREEMRKVWGTSAYSIVTTTLEIPDTCDVCGGKRGQPTPHRTHEDGETVYPDVWHNPCGHVDKYADIIKRHGARA